MHNTGADPKGNILFIKVIKSRKWEKNARNIILFRCSKALPFLPKNVRVEKYFYRIGNYPVPGLYSRAFNV